MYIPIFTSIYLLLCKNRTDGSCLKTFKGFGDKFAIDMYAWCVDSYSPNLDFIKCCPIFNSFAYQLFQKAVIKK